MHKHIDRGPGFTHHEHDDCGRRTTPGRRESDTILGVLSDDELAATLHAACAPESEHRLCRDCDDDAAHACDGCGVPLCKEHGAPNRDGERVCWECRQPPRCPDQPCPYRSQTYSGRCRKHHALWAAKFDALMRRVKEGQKHLGLTEVKP